MIGSAVPRLRRGEPCVCGSRSSYDGCCGPLHDGAPARTAEALMRSRYAAYVLGLEDHVFRTWHPRTRPDGVLVPGVTWLGLRVLRTEGGAPDDTTGVVEFEADHDAGGGAVRTLHEVSRFERRAGRWVYVDAAG